MCVILHSQLPKQTQNRHFMAFPHDGRKMKKGETLNPKGRPKKIPDLDVLLSEKGQSEYQAVINSLFKQAKKGNVRAAEVLLDRAYGKVKQDLGIDAEVLINVTRKIVK